ncbi:hypothetical protein [Nocardia gipuzkoensis]
MGCPQCRRVAPVHNDVIGEHAGLSGYECPAAGLHVVDDRSDFVIGGGR